MQFQFAYPVTERPNGTVGVGENLTQYTAVVRGTASKPLPVPLEFPSQEAFQAWLTGNGIAYLPRSAVPKGIRFGQSAVQS